MNRALKRITAILMAILLCASTYVSTFAVTETDTKMTVTVSSVDGRPGESIDVKINLKNSPGLTSLKFNVVYGDILTLKNVEFNSEFGDMVTAKMPYESPQTLSFISPFKAVNSNGTFATLTFDISENAKSGDRTEISLSYDADDIIDGNDDVIPINTVSGIVTVFEGIPGDINGDKKVNNADAIMLFRYVAGWNVNADKKMLDCNGDGKVNNADAILLFRFVAGYPVTIVPPKPENICEHALTPIARKEATCTDNGNEAYWHCEKCGRYFDDANATNVITLADTVIKAGHNPKPVDAVPATPTLKGYTAGVWCDKCETWISGHEEIPPIKADEANITYRLWYVKGKTKSGSIEITEDSYLQKQQITNDNPDTYEVGKGIPSLERASADGYDFLGWFEYPEVDAKRVYSIPSTAKDDIILYAVWEKHEFEITYLQDSPGSTLPKVEKGKFTIDKETALEPQSWPNLVWIGWSDEEGNILKSIPKGTARDITLTANWMSKRNQTVPNTNYKNETPAIANLDSGIYTFTYEIGEIQNVPIQQVEEGVEGKGFNLVKGATHEINKEFTEVIEEGEATNVANIVANATTKSDSWTLSEDWNKSTSFSQEHSNEVTEEQTQKASLSLSETGKYSLSAGVGGSKEHTDEKGKSTKTTKKDEYGVSVNIGTKTEKTAGVNANLGASIGTDEAGKASAGIGAELEKKKTNEKNLGLSYKHTDETTKEKNETHTDKTSSNWNVNEGFETSKSISKTDEMCRSIGQSIKDTYEYGEVLDFGGSNSNTVSSSNTSSNSREYSSSVTYSKEKGSKLNVRETLTGEAETGFYRKVLTANFKVFAVVIYDINKSSYSTMTYSLKIKDSERLFTDYSLLSSFNDYENGVLPFEVPYKVSEYVYSLVGCSDGLRINDETGIIEGYGYKNPETGICYKKYNRSTGVYSEPCDTDVILPQYAVINRKIVPIKGFVSSAFSGTNITSVYLNFGISEIPNNAFKDCTELKYITGGNITSIGEGAFENCTALYEMNLGSHVTNIGMDAFKGTNNALTVVAANADVAKAAVASGVKELTLDLSKLSDSLSKTKIQTPDIMTRFSLIGDEKSFDDLIIESDAETVEISNITLNSTSEIPLKFSSKNVNLSFITVNAPGFVMRLSAGTANIVLDGNNYIKTNSGKAVLCRNINVFEKEDSLAIGKLRVNGDVLVCGNVSGNQNNVVFDSGLHNFRYLDENEYQNYLESKKITFDANGGICDIKTMDVSSGTLDTLPVPTKEYCTFDGWYTQKDGGEKITAENDFDSDITLYAHWKYIPYYVDWDSGINCTINVSRTSSPNANAPTGTLTSGAEVYYGDVLSVAYTPATGYSLVENGEQNITVTGNVGSDAIYATASANSYTYNIKYKSVNGTDLGSSTATYKYGTTSTISAPAKTGYNTPASQTVAWDSTSPKTITFTYGIKSVTNPQDFVSGYWYEPSKLSYSSTIECRNRTANSVEVRVKWKNTISEGTTFYGYGQKFHISAKKDSGYNKNVTIASNTYFYYNGAKTTHAAKSSDDVYSNWLTITGLQPTQTTVTVWANYYATNCESGGIDKYVSKSVTIPTF